jgi:S-adenosylmethionine/arginine decarboxylase-like enzyme
MEVAGRQIIVESHLSLHSHPIAPTTTATASTAICLLSQRARARAKSKAHKVWEMNNSR